MTRATSTSNAKHSQQQPITALIGERVRKVRTFTPDGPPTKRAKLQEPVDAPVAAKTAPIATSTSAPTNTVQSQKRKWRLTEIIKKDREARRLKSTAQPSFVFVPSTASALSAQTDASANTGVHHRAKTGAPSKRSTTGRLSSTPTKRQHAVATATASTTRRTATACLSGGEAIRYGRDMLPKSHGLLLDILTSMETAVGLLRMRRASATVGSIRDIVQKDTKRNFTLRLLSQLAHLVPECVAVLSGRAVTSRYKRASDNLVVRLDDPDVLNAANGRLPTLCRDGDGSMMRDSVLSDSVSLVRRARLHQALLKHVDDQHEAFLDENSLRPFDGIGWHADFDLERDVVSLPAPPLYVESGARPKALQSVTASASKDTTDAKEFTGDVDETTQDTCVTDDTTASIASVVKDDDDKETGTQDLSGIPQSLLARVRSREKAHEEQGVKVEEERVSNRSLLSKLPCTMDTINTVLRTERRLAMGWRQLVTKVCGMHPRKWSKEDMDQQLDVITKLATDWCKKVELKSSGGGFAFRVLSEKGFAQARAKVCATESVELP